MFDTFAEYNWQTDIGNQQVADIVALLFQERVCCASRLQAFAAIQPTKVDLEVAGETISGEYYDFAAVSRDLSRVDVSSDVAAAAAVESSYRAWNQSGKELFAPLCEALLRAYDAVIATDSGWQSEAYYAELALFPELFPKLRQQMTALRDAQAPHEWRRAVMILSVYFPDLETLRSSQHLPPALTSALQAVVDYLQQQVLPWVLSFALKKGWPTLFPRDQVMPEEPSSLTSRGSASSAGAARAGFYQPAPTTDLSKQVVSTTPAPGRK